MYEGKIIKYYRERYHMTQEQLGKGICSGTHISKIERLQTEYAPEIITLLSERLGINIEQEIINLRNIKKRLEHWQNVIIKQLFQEMQLIYEELEKEELISISNYVNLYRLLHIRYLLMHNSSEDAFDQIKELQKIEHKLSPYELNLLRHVLGIYYLSKHEHQNAINALKAINEDDYNNEEYYYHLAMAYHSNEQPVLAYFAADKARQFFKKINSYLRVIDAEMIMLIQVKDDGENSEAIEGFKNLIQSCDVCQSPERKARVLHNLAFEYFRRNEYELASKYYYESMSLKDRESNPYLLSLEGYIRSSFYGNFLTEYDLLNLSNEGLETAIKKNDELYINLFTLLSYLIQNKEQDYHQYLSNYSLPIFKKYGLVYLIKRSKKELFNHFYKMKRTSKALKMANYLINQ